MNNDYMLSNYSYVLPQECIAQFPNQKRDESRLMVLRQRDENPIITVFSDILNFLPPRSLIVINDTKVVPARMSGWLDNSQKGEVLLLTPVALLENEVRRSGEKYSVQADVLLKPSRSLKAGMNLKLPCGIDIFILAKKAFGQCRVELEWTGGRLVDILERHGTVPLPPYIKRKATMCDQLRYQTVYASDAGRGAVAAPTAGLHFTEELSARLIEAGHDWHSLTLFVGCGTFTPIRCKDIRDHVMHSEYIRVPHATAEGINAAMRENRPIIAVGTTSLRTLEGVFQKFGHMLPYQGMIDTYIYPGFRFQVINGLITNFHLPESSLLVLVSALIGRERILSAYRKAVEQKMRFFSYGDAMFIDVARPLGQSGPG